jgi:hypothetical protein
VKGEMIMGCSATRKETMGSPCLVFEAQPKSSTESVLYLPVNRQKYYIL